MITAREAGLVACTRCHRVWREGQTHCGRCGHKLASRDKTSLQRVWAFWLVGLLCYIPANALPMLQTRTLFQTDDSTIVGGAVDLALHGSWAVAAIILVASIAIPLAKFWVIAYLAIGVQSRRATWFHQRHRLYQIVEYIGRWSMIDIFVVAILSSLVQLKALAAINPGPAAIFFALSVVFTMLSAQAFDARTIWDLDRHKKGKRGHVRPAAKH